MSTPIVQSADVRGFPILEGLGQPPFGQTRVSAFSI